jgi:hypothetical protein
MQATLFLLITLVPAFSADVAEDVLLKEDYQVLQRDSADASTCTVVLPATLQIASCLTITVEDARGKPIRQAERAPVDLRDGGRGVVIEKLPVGGPYAITIAAAGNREQDGIRFRNILVGDIWILGGQSNIFGIDLIKEKLPALPYLSMLNLLHFAKDAHWCAGEPPIHRIPEPFAENTLKRQHPDYSDATIREILDSKTPVGGIDCSHFLRPRAVCGERRPDRSDSVRHRRLIENKSSLITASRRQELRIGAAEGVAEKVEGLHGTLLAAP